MNKALSKEEITKLLQGNSKPSPWPSEDDQKRLAKAVKAEQDTVTFTDGREYSITHKPHLTPPAVFLKPTSGAYVPCGYFNLERLRQLR